MVDSNAAGRASDERMATLHSISHGRRTRCVGKRCLFGPSASSLRVARLSDCLAQSRYSVYMSSDVLLEEFEVTALYLDINIS